MKKVKLTIEDLAEMMHGGFKDSDKKIEDLAIMVQGGFKVVDKKMVVGFKDVYKKMEVGFKKADDKMEVGFQAVYKTIEDLAIMVQNGFEEAKTEVNQRFDLVDKRFNKIEDWQHFADGKFDVIEHELISIKHDLENVVHRNEFENIRERVECMEVLSGSKKK